MCGGFFVQEGGRFIGKMGACRVAFVVGDLFMHDIPQALKWVGMRAIERDEMQLVSAWGALNPLRRRH
jgi:hypothetical protein